MEREKEEERERKSTWKPEREVAAGRKGKGWERGKGGWGVGGVYER